MEGGPTRPDIDPDCINMAMICIEFLSKLHTRSRNFPSSKGVKLEEQFGKFRENVNQELFAERAQFNNRQLQRSLQSR